MPDDTELDHTKSEQVRALFLFMDEVIEARGWRLDWENVRSATARFC
jgi:hypothetical protein